MTVIINFDQPPQDAVSLGKIGEHNATTIEVTGTIAGASVYRLAFATNGQIITSEPFTAQPITYKLSQQLTASPRLSVQLIGYDTNGDLIAKTKKLTNYYFEPSIGRATAPEDTGCYDIYAEIATKQDKLTAGKNITITPDNVISAEGGTYTAGDGIKIADEVIAVDTSVIATREYADKTDPLIVTFGDLDNIQDRLNTAYNNGAVIMVRDSQAVGSCLCYLYSRLGSEGIGWSYYFTGQMGNYNFMVQYLATTNEWKHQYYLHEDANHKQQSYDGSGQANMSYYSCKATNENFATKQDLQAEASARANADAGKVAIMETPTDNRVYAYIHHKNAQGVEYDGSRPLSQTANAGDGGTIVQRTTANQVNVALAPTENSNATSKKYVDGVIATCLANAKAYTDSQIATVLATDFGGAV